MPTRGAGMIFHPIPAGFNHWEQTTGICCFAVSSVTSVIVAGEDGSWQRAAQRSCMSFTCLSNWRRSSVVRTSVFGRSTFPALHPIYGWQVTTSWVNCLLWVSCLCQHVFTWIMGVVTIKTTDWLRTAVWLQAKVRESGLELRPRMNAGPVCDV